MKKMSMSNWNQQEEKYHPLMDDIYLKAANKGGTREMPFVFASRQTIAASIARIKLFELILETKGSIIECGCHKGNNLFLFYHLSSIFEPFAFNRTIVGFDTFEGFRSHKDYENVNKSDFSDTDFDILINVAEVSDLNRPLGHIPKIELIKGDATKTIPEYIKNNDHLLVALLYLDFDIYEPTKVALEYLYDRVVSGGIVVFDELNSKKFPGETKVYREFFKRAELKKFSFEPWLSYFIVP